MTGRSSNQPSGHSRDMGYFTGMLDQEILTVTGIPRVKEDLGRPRDLLWKSRCVEKHTGKPGTIEQLEIAEKDLCGILGEDRRDLCRRC